MSQLLCLFINLLLQSLQKSVLRSVRRRQLLILPLQLTDQLSLLQTNGNVTRQATKQNCVLFRVGASFAAGKEDHTNRFAIRQQRQGQTGFHSFPTNQPGRYRLRCPGKVFVQIIDDARLTCGQQRSQR